MALRSVTTSEIGKIYSVLMTKNIVSFVQKEIEKHLDNVNNADVNVARKARNSLSNYAYRLTGRSIPAIIAQ